MTSRQRPAYRSDAAGRPKPLVAFCTAATTARAMVSAASAPTAPIRYSSAGSPPVPRENTVSPSNGMWAGRIDKAKPSCAIWATFVACALDHFRFVATTPRVVFSVVSVVPSRQPDRSIDMVSAKPSPLSLLAPATMLPVSGSTTSPSALTAASAPTTRPFSSAIAAEPNPPRMPLPAPSIFPTVAPAPAPTLPICTGPREADSAARKPALASGRTLGSPSPRSNRIAAGTIGTIAALTRSPTSRLSRYRITPSAAARP